MSLPDLSCVGLSEFEASFDVAVSVAASDTASVTASVVVSVAASVVASAAAAVVASSVFPQPARSETDITATSESVIIFFFILVSPNFEKYTDFSVGLVFLKSNRL